MKGNSLLGKLSLIALLAIASQSCKKENGIDNNNVIETPYVLYASDASGNVFKTNDGQNYSTIFPGDGTPLRAIITSKQNILLAKNQTLFFSENEGKTFNPYPVVKLPVNIPWPYFILDVKSYERIQCANIYSMGGVSQSQWDNGKSFDNDTNWVNDTAYSTESFTELEDGLVYAYSLSGGKQNISRLYYKAGKDKPWTPRPASLPTPNRFYLSHYNNTLVATDYDNLAGSWYSNDSGKSFQQYLGLPTTVTLYATCGKYNQLLIGTQSKGVYRLSGTTFVASNSGLHPNPTVYSIVAKENYYKNNVTKQFFYIATDKGIYRSEDLAKSWIKVKEGDYRLLY